MKDTKSKKTADNRKRVGGSAKPDNSNVEKTNAQKQKDATAGEVPYAPTIGRHGVDEEKQLNPEE